MNPQNHYFNIDLKKFNSYWEGSTQKVAIMDIPSAINNFNSSTWHHPDIKNYFLRKIN